MATENGQVQVDFARSRVGPLIRRDDSCIAAG